MYNKKVQDLLKGLGIGTVQAELLTLDLRIDDALRFSVTTNDGNKVSFCFDPDLHLIPWQNYFKGIEETIRAGG